MGRAPKGGARAPRTAKKHEEMFVHVPELGETRICQPLSGKPNKRGLVVVKVFTNTVQQVDETRYVEMVTRVPYTCFAKGSLALLTHRDSRGLPIHKPDDDDDESVPPPSPSPPPTTSCSREWTTQGYYKDVVVTTDGAESPVKIQEMWSTSESILTLELKNAAQADRKRKEAQLQRNTYNKRLTAAGSSSIFYI